jgi:hypothetical protein
VNVNAPQGSQLRVRAGAITGAPIAIG